MALARCEFDATDEGGVLLTSVSVEVRDEATNALAPLFSDRSGATPISNPFVDADGKVGFHVAGGAYKITLTAGAFARTIRYKAIGLNAERDGAQEGPGLSSGDWALPRGITSITDRTPAVDATVTAWPFFFAEPTIIVTVRLHLTLQQAGAEARAGIYTNVNGRPVALLADLGTVDLSSGTGTDKDFPISPTITVSGWVWVLVWVKNVATQATFKGPNSTTTIGTAQLSSALSGSTGRCWLYLQDTYPGSMPATAPAVVPNASASVPLVMIKVD